MLQPSVGLRPEDLAAAMANCAWCCARNPLQLLSWNHNHGNALIASRTAEMGGQICRQLKVCLLSQACVNLQHHMAARTFLGVKPEITRSGLPQADPIVLTMIPADLQPQPPWC